ncbi:MAG TPA: HD domain-containing protein [Anaerolineales bacterium]
MMPTIEQASHWYPLHDPVHGFDHVLRVVRLAERLAQAEGADPEIVRAAALLHDAQGDEMLATSEDGHSTRSEEGGPDRLIEGSTDHLNEVGHAREAHHHISAVFAARVLRLEGWPEERIAAVQHCIRAHRFRDRREPPQTLEAQVLFDADKLDAIGAIGAARAVAYAAQAGLPAYSPPSEQFRRTGQLEPGEIHSAYHEYLFKLSKLEERLYTPTARSIAVGRHHFMDGFFQQIIAETEGQR